MNPIIEFVSPPECPVYYPKGDDWADPLGFIAKIRPEAEKIGLCKIIPPSDWQPPFAIDVDHFTFTPRRQRLNELEATTRVRLNFLDEIARFWELQGSSLRLPNVERRVLDLYKLHKVVKEEGGFEKICFERKWSKIATRMGYDAGKGIGSLLKTHYERILYPYDIFKSGLPFEAKVKKAVESETGHGTYFPSYNVKREQAPTAACDKRDRDYKPHSIPSRMAIPPKVESQNTRRSKRNLKEMEVEVKQDDQMNIIDYSANSELRKLQFFGPGPKAPGLIGTENETKSPEVRVKEEKEEVEVVTVMPAKGTPKKQKSGKKTPELINIADKYFCMTCCRGDVEEQMLLCDGCDDPYHTFCLIPPLSEIPKGDWRCPRCVKKVCDRPRESFGFEQARNEYTLQSFGEMADTFKSEYFNMPIHMVNCSTVEKEYWRLTQAVDEDVTVEYGADLSTLEKGSGFPTKDTVEAFPDDVEYVESAWNLNKLSILEGSVLDQVPGDISGMKVPWVYIGMCFSTFCWHTEDHWSYSINYMHWGEPKTWYGAPGSAAEDLEKVMMDEAPELFAADPDLVHQIVTILHPNILMEKGVPITRTDQHPGEFVVTFPRSYHAGFNQGYNCAEAVNFCPADWIHMGRECIANYRFHHRYCVFSHEELICKLASNPEGLTIDLAAATYQDMLVLIDEESKLRKQVLTKGTVNAERHAFELLPDDERICAFCKTTCFLSAIFCSCKPTSLACLYHCDKVCDCPMEKKMLRYRYTLDELPTMLMRLKQCAESFDQWSIRARKMLSSSSQSAADRPVLDDLKDLLAEYSDHNYPHCDAHDDLKAAIVEVDKCVTVAQQLISYKVRTRKSTEKKYFARLTLTELQQFVEQVKNLPCKIPEEDQLQDLLIRVLEFQKKARETLKEATPNTKVLDELLDQGHSFNIELPEMAELKEQLQQARWLDEVQEVMSDNDVDGDYPSLDILRKLLDAGVNHSPHPAIECAMAQLQQQLTEGEAWEEKAKKALHTKPPLTLNDFEALIHESDKIPLTLPSLRTVNDTIRKSKEWMKKVEATMNTEAGPYIETLELLANKGRQLPVDMEPLSRIESLIAAGKMWKERAELVFLKRNTPFSLLEVLSPRCDFSDPQPKKYLKRRRESAEMGSSDPPAAKVDIQFDSNADVASVVAAFKSAESKELLCAQELRTKNEKKYAEDAGDARYCVCRKPRSGFMLQCEVCHDWFHCTCIPAPKSNTNQRVKVLTPSLLQSLRSHIFLCPGCMRTRRPRLDNIIALLVALQKMPVRLPEGEALKCLAERAMVWQNDVTAYFDTDDMKAVLAAYCKQPGTPESNPESSKLMALLQQNAPPVLQNNVLKTPERPTQHVPVTEELALDMSRVAHSSAGPFSECDRPPKLSPVCEVENTVSNAAHSPGLSPGNPAELAAFVQLTESAESSPEITDGTLKALAEFLLKGSLLEVDLEETDNIWRVLDAYKQHKEKKDLLDFETMDVDAPILQTKSKGCSDLDKPKKLKRKQESPDENNAAKQQRANSSHASCAMSIPTATTSTAAATLRVSDTNKMDVDDAKLEIIEKDAQSKQPKDGSVRQREIMETIEKVIQAGLKVGDFPMDDVAQVVGDAKPKKRSKKDSESSASSVQSTSSVTSKNGKKKDMKKTEKPSMPNDTKHELEAPHHIGLLDVIDRVAEGREDSDTESEESCSADSCLGPLGDGDEVLWVQCDGCEMWFHPTCVGLNESDVNDHEDFICNRCAAGVPPKCQTDIENVEKHAESKTLGSHNKVVNKKEKRETVAESGLNGDCAASLEHVDEVSVATTLISLSNQTVTEALVPLDLSTVTNSTAGTNNVNALCQVSSSSSSKGGIVVNSAGKSQKVAQTKIPSLKSPVLVTESSKLSVKSFMQMSETPKIAQPVAAVQPSILSTTPARSHAQTSSMSVESEAQSDGSVASKSMSVMHSAPVFTNSSVSSEAATPAKPLGMGSSSPRAEKDAGSRLTHNGLLPAQMGSNDDDQVFGTYKTYAREIHRSEPQLPGYNADNVSPAVAPSVQRSPGLLIENTMAQSTHSPAKPQLVSPSKPNTCLFPSLSPDLQTETSPQPLSQQNQPLSPQEHFSRAADGHSPRAAGSQSPKAQGGQSPRAQGGQSPRAVGDQSSRVFGGLSPRSVVHDLSTKRNLFEELNM